MTFVLPIGATWSVTVPASSLVQVTASPTRRARRIPLGILAGLALATLAVAPAAPAGAAQGVSIVADPAQITATPPTTYVPYALTISNTGSSNLTQAILVVADPAGASYAGASTSACAPTSSGATCDLGQIASGAVRRLTLFYAATGGVGDAVRFPSSGTTLTVKDDSTSQNGDPGRTATYQPDGVSVSLVATSGDTAVNIAPPTGGTFGTSGTDIGSGSQLGTGNPQATAVDVPVTDQWIPVGIREYTGGADCTTKKRKCFGEVSDTNVDLPGGSTLGIFVRWDLSILPNNKSAKNLGVAHKYDGSSNWVEIGLCGTANPAADAPCREPARTLPDGDLYVRIWLLSNGLTRGF